MFGGAIDGYELGEAMGVLGWLGREAGEGNFRGAARSSASGEKKEKQGSRAVGAPRGVDEHAGDLSTSRRARAAKQLRG